MKARLPLKSHDGSSKDAEDVLVGGDDPKEDEKDGYDSNDDPKNSAPRPSARIEFVQKMKPTATTTQTTTATTTTTSTTIITTTTDKN